MIDPDRFIAIQREERQRTMEQIDALPLSAEARGDVLQLWVRLQEAVNAYVREQDRYIDHRVLPTVARLMADEAERVVGRLAAGEAP